MWECVDTLGFVSTASLVVVSRQNMSRKAFGIWIAIHASTRSLGKPRAENVGECERWASKCHPVVLVLAELDLVIRVGVDLAGLGGAAADGEV